MVVVAKVRNPDDQSKSTQGCQDVDQTSPRSGFGDRNRDRRGDRCGHPHRSDVQSGQNALVGGVCSPESGLKQHIEEGDASSNQDGSQIEEGEVDNPNGRSDRHCDQN